MDFSIRLFFLLKFPGAAAVTAARRAGKTAAGGTGAAVIPLNRPPGGKAVNKAVLPAVQLDPTFAHIAGGADGAAFNARVHPDQGADANQGDHCTHTQRNTHDFTHRA